MKAIIICVTLLAAASAAYGQFCMCAPGPTVCGSDYQNYDGECNMKCSASQQGKTLYVIHNGPCEEIYPPPNPNPYYPPNPYNPYGTCDPCGIFSRYQPYNPYNPYNPYDPYSPFGSGKQADN